MRSTLLVTDCPDPGARHTLNPHAYHRNLPPHHIDPRDGIPYVTKFAEKKARAVMKLARSIKLTEDMFLPDFHKPVVAVSEAEGETNRTEGDDGNDAIDDGGDTMRTLTKKCNRLNKQLTSLFNLKHSGLSQNELCEIILHVLRLLSASVKISETAGDDLNGVAEEMEKARERKDSAVGLSLPHCHRHVSLQFDDVGDLVPLPEPGTQASTDHADQQKLTTEADSPSELEKQLSDPFALPSPAREALLSVAILLLSKKGPLRAVSNTALFSVEADNCLDGTTKLDKCRQLLVINWRALLRMLLRTAPYLDEHKVGDPPMSSTSRQNTVLKRTVNMIRRCRRFFDQGIARAVAATAFECRDTTAKDVWDMVKSDLLYHTHSNSCFRAVIMLYLFQPSRCTSDFYVEVMPRWLESWSSVDRCSEFDFIWLVLFCRARKYVVPGTYDWAPLRRRLLTQCGHWLQIPVGGSADDRSFPRAARPRRRGFPARLKSLVGSGSLYQDGIDFVAKVSKLLVFGIGNSDVVYTDSVDAKDEKGVNVNSTTAPPISSGAQDVLRFMAFVAPYFNPSNIGAWTFPLGAFIHYFSYEFCHRTGVAGSLKALRISHPRIAEELCTVEPSQTLVAIPVHEIVAVLDALLPLCQQALYSKNGHVGRAGESALLYLTQIDPVHVSPPFLDFATRALDISSINLSHQAPAALSALTRLVQPSLRRHPVILLERLPEILRLSLAGIDSNDQDKSLRTLIFYRNLTSWLPVGGKPIDWAARSTVNVSGDANGTIRMGQNLLANIECPTLSLEYKQALARLPEYSLMYQGDASEAPTPDDDKVKLEMLLEETAFSMSDWALAFLDRVYAMLRAAGQQEKKSKSQSGVASRHTSADATQAQNFSRVMKECLIQVFSSMDSTSHCSAVRSVTQFLNDETLPFAAKDASSLCQAVGCARLVTNDTKTNNTSPGLAALVPLLTADLRHHSNKTSTYRLRCLAGAVRFAGQSVLEHRVVINDALRYAFSMHDDKHLFKTGCKLLRHTIASQCESYPIASDGMPRITAESSTEDSTIQSYTLGKSAHLEKDGVQWHVPTGDQLDFVSELLQEFVLVGINELSSECSTIKKVDTMETSSFVTVNGADVSESNSDKEAEAPRHDKAVLDLPKWRRIFRVLRYGLRGCAGILLDGDEGISLLESMDAEDVRDDNDFVPHEMANRTILRSASTSTQETLLRMRGKLCSFVVSTMSLIADGSGSESADPESDSDMAVDKNNPSSEEHPHSGEQELDKRIGRDDWSQTRKMRHPNIGADAKVCKETIEVALLLLLRRGAAFRSQSAMTVWSSQKQLLTDYALSAEADHMASALQRAALYCDCKVNLYKDGEDGGKSLTRRLLVTRVNLFYQAMQRSASFEIPLRLQRMKRGRNVQALDYYEGIIDGLFAMSCASNVDVRGSALGAVDYALTRFGWVVRERVPRLMSAISLNDEDMNGKFGIPSCALLSKQFDAQGKRKRLAEALKGVCSITASSRSMKEILSTEANRFCLVQTFCKTEELIALLPAEEMQKMVHYFQTIFSQFRSNFFVLPRITEDEQRQHERCLALLLDHLLTDAPQKMPSTESVEIGFDRELGSSDYINAEAKSMHWRYRLIVGWFLMSFVDNEDLLMDDPTIAARLWKTCFHLIENETGQPLQRVAVGLFGRLVSLALAQEEQLDFVPDCMGKDSKPPNEPSNLPDFSILCSRLCDEQFCRALGTALVYDHKEDSSVGGGHDAQWSAGVEEILRDALANVAPRTLFPFQRTSRSSQTFKVEHAQFVQAMLRAIGHENAKVSVRHLLSFAKEMASAPPSEDQRNQQCTAAEIFAGVCRAMLQLVTDPSERKQTWDCSLLPFLEDVVPLIPISLSGALYDAFRYGIHHFPPSSFHELTKWAIGKIELTLWQHEITDGGEARPVPMHSLDAGQQQSEAMENNTAKPIQTTDGFASQSKWLFLTSAVMIELDDETDLGAVNRLPWYTPSLLVQSANLSIDEEVPVPMDDLKHSWETVSKRLLPCLLKALGHPYEKCREHIAGCLFRICYCHKKFLTTSKATRTSSMTNNTTWESYWSSTEQDPGDAVISKLCSIGSSSNFSFKEKHNALITAHKFIIYCVHLGDGIHEYSNFIIPLLPLAFEALKATVGESNEDDDGESGANAANRALEAEVVKSYRYSLSLISSCCLIVYGKDEDMTRVLTEIEKASKHEFWQVRQTAANFLRCFQGCHKFLFGKNQAETTMNIVAALLADDRREVSSAAMAALTGILAVTPLASVNLLVKKYARIANRSVIRKKNKKKHEVMDDVQHDTVVSAAAAHKEQLRAKNQQSSVFFLCAAVLARPYDAPSYVPEALAALSKHSYERRAPLGVRDTVKMCCSEFKRTHMSDNWEVHRKQFSQEQLEALEDVVSTPHYYA